MPVIAFFKENEALVNPYKNFIITLLIVANLPLIAKTAYLSYVKKKKLQRQQSHSADL
jgi:hypothetical protein